ncbi:hypothetical protein EYB26_000332 [Talaromyces marneffei]|uniref:uncharacterized protein n=1 Tax=Talaromyces marneffei TaxID=37727 RepID=UPI0012AA66AD|nr:uncharacterized protein EYB26_000332 [Talaromyces marneffei]QGA12688.1 hypothetical protein EYB26_000332 [Talaromyces marneffei]
MCICHATRNYSVGSLRSTVQLLTLACNSNNDFGNTICAAALHPSPPISSQENRANIAQVKLNPIHHGSSRSTSSGFKQWIDKRSTQRKDHQNLTPKPNRYLNHEGAYQSGQLARELSGEMVAIFASPLFHMWDYEDQLLAAKRMAVMCEVRPGVMITGRQLGSYLGGRYPMNGMREDGDKFKNYRHSEQTIRGFWHR